MRDTHEQVSGIGFGRKRFYRAGVSAVLSKRSSLRLGPGFVSSKPFEI
jgi:hypothetical protein